MTMFGCDRCSREPSLGEGGLVNGIEDRFDRLPVGMRKVVDVDLGPQEEVLDVGLPVRMLDAKMTADSAGWSAVPGHPYTASCPKGSVSNQRNRLLYV